MFYKGYGATYFPCVPLVDQALGKGLARKGFSGSRKRGESVFAAVEEGHARHYAQDEENVLSVLPLPGSFVTWVEGVDDLVLEFSSWLRTASNDERFPGGVRAFLRDVQGDVDIFDTYLALKRQEKAIATVVDAFLAGMVIREIEVGDGVELSVGDHKGEVWITGPCEMVPPATTAPSP